MKHTISHATIKGTLGLIVACALVCILVPLAWAVFYFGIYLGYGNYKVKGHQDFAANSVALITPAHEMDQLYADCRHFITYTQADSPVFNSVAYFGGRYELTMQVPVDIQSATSGSMIGSPIFYLHEISSVTVLPGGQVNTSYSRGLEFGPREWATVYSTNGNYSTIGFNVITTPVANYAQHVTAARP